MLRNTEIGWRPVSDDHMPSSYAAAHLKKTVLMICYFHLQAK
jgi:hypothetical protein